MIYIKNLKKKINFIYINLKKKLINIKQLINFNRFIYYILINLIN